jgi:hypothetical protein
MIWDMKAEPFFIQCCSVLIICINFCQIDSRLCLLLVVYNCFRTLTVPREHEAIV